MTLPPNVKIVFKDQHLGFNFLKRFIIQLLSYTLFAFSIILSLIFLGSENVRLQATGLLLLIFLFDLVVSRNTPRIIFESELFEKKEINSALYLSRSARNTVTQALMDAELNKMDFDWALLSRLLEKRGIIKSLLRLEIPVKKLIEKVGEQKNKLSSDVKTNYFNKLQGRLSEDVILAFRQALEIREKFISDYALFLALCETNDTYLNELFETLEIKKADISNAFVLSSLPVPKPNQLIKGVADFYRLKAIHGQKFRIDRAWTAKPTPYLDQFSIDLTDLARHSRIGFLIGHQKEYQSVVNILTRTDKNNVLLLGESGSGKDTIVSYLALQIARDNVPNGIKDNRLIALNIASLVSEVKTPTEILERLERISKEIVMAQNVILYLQDFHNLKTGFEKGAVGVMEILKPLFSLNQVRVIGATMPKEFHQSIEPDAVLCSLFEIIRVEEVSEEEAIRIVTYESLALEKRNKITISYKTIKRAVMLAHRYLKPKLLPNSAEDLLKEAISGAINQRKKTLTEEDVLNLVSVKTKIPLETSTASEKDKLLNLEKLIHERLINQEEAVVSVASAMRQYRAGLSRKSGPIASFLFVGPTGVGKTELAKTLAEIYFGSESNMIRFDMSEYQDIKSINHFIGSPEGEVSGVLTESVKTKPFSLILLDEFEKAHPNVLNIFLAILDEGHATDNLGTTIDFTNTIIIATSNALSDFIKQEMEKGISNDELAKALKIKLGNFFRPELLNRFDDVIVFKPLSQENIVDITKLQLKNLAKTALEKGIVLNFSQTAIKQLAQLGYSPIFGARPLRSVVRNFVQEPLAQMILKEEVAKHDKLVVDYQGEQFVMTKQ